MTGVSFHALADGGHVGELIRAKDWGATPLGAMEAWPRSLRNHLSMIFELPTAAIIFWGPEQIQLYNDGYAVIMGPRHPRHLGSTFRECWPEAYEGIYPWMQRVLHRGETVEVNRTLVPLTRFGFVEESYFTFSFSPLRDDDGTIAGILQLVTEVTAEVIGERRAAALHALANQITQTSTPRDVIRATSAVLGANADDVPFSLTYLVDGADRARLVLAGSSGSPPDTLSSALPELAVVVNERRMVMIESGFAAPIIAADGSVSAVLVGGISPRLVFDDRYRGFVELVCAQLASLLAVARAREELESKNAELDRQYRVIQAATRQKSDFLANMSHEIRTPLNAILGFTELIHDGRIPANTPQHSEFLGHVLTSARHLLQLINDILDLAKVEAGKIELRPEPVELARLIHEVVDIVGAIAAGKHVQVDVAVAAELGVVTVDPSRTKQILYNFLSNALKFTPEGGRVEVRAVPEAGQRFRLEVSDTGPGIAAADLARLFTEFTQLEAGRRHIGSGLGLALTRRLVEAQGGEAGVTSTVGVGSTFHAVLPRHVARSTAGPQVAPRPYPPGAPRVLVVEDTAKDQAAVVAVLESAGIGVELAETGADAVARCRQERFDAIVLDLFLPDANGLDVLHQLRAEGPNRDVPVIVSTVVAEQDAMGGVAVHDMLRKPVDRRQLLASLERAGVAPGAGQILIVDDDPAARAQMEVALASRELRTVCAGDGAEALALLQDMQPQAVVLDLSMPRMDGFEFMLRFRQLPTCRHVPVIVWTAKDLTADDYRRLREATLPVVRKSQGSEALVEELRAVFAQS